MVSTRVSGKSKRNAGRLHAVRLPADIKHHLPHQIITLANQLSRHATANYSRQYGLSFAEWRLLAVVGAAQPIPMIEASRELGVDKALVSRLSAALIARRILAAQGHPGDARRSSLILTRKGAELHDRVNKFANERLARLLSCMTEAERKTFSDVAARLLDQIRGEMKEDFGDSPTRRTAPK